MGSLKQYTADHWLEGISALIGGYLVGHGAYVWYVLQDEMARLDNAWSEVSTGKDGKYYHRCKVLKVICIIMVSLGLALLLLPCIMFFVRRRHDHHSASASAPVSSAEAVPLITPTPPSTAVESQSRLSSASIIAKPAAPPASDSNPQSLARHASHTPIRPDELRSGF
jgi:hypothetical protein